MQGFDSCGSVVPKGTTDLRQPEGRPSFRPALSGAGARHHIWPVGGALDRPSTGLRLPCDRPSTGPRPADVDSRRRPVDVDLKTSIPVVPWFQRGPPNFGAGSPTGPLTGHTGSRCQTSVLTCQTCDRPSTGLRPALASHATGHPPAFDRPSPAMRPALHRPSPLPEPQDFDSCGSVVTR